ncbi:MAG: hypothetical protein EXR07_16155 [Acetobacteraceae bacterium]|nr:hypothetical protein [Acetobacteraceae bacterium]
MNAIEMEPLLVTGPVARKLIGVGNTKYWQLVKSGKVTLVEVGGRRMATYASLKELAKPDAA